MLAYQGDAIVSQKKYGIGNELKTKKEALNSTTKPLAEDNNNYTR